MKKVKPGILRGTAALSVIATLALGMPAYAETLTFFTGNDQATVDYSNALAKAFEAKNPGVKVEVEVGPGGTERDNMVKSRLATGTMSDVFVYNAGSLFQAINPMQTTVDLSKESWQGDVVDSFKQVVTSTDGAVRGGPFGQAMGGGVLYNIPLYKKLGLSVPKDWAEFMANGEKIKAAGIPAVVQTFGDTWTSQLFVLADYYNVQAADPTFAQDYTAGKAKYATTPSALASFQHQEDVYKAGFLNKDFGAAKLDDGLRMVATGEGAQYPMLTFALGTVGTNYPDNLNDVGFFAMPGANPDKNGLTVWMPTGIYVAAGGPHVDLAKKFVAFAESKEACDIQVKTAPVTGPFLLKSCPLPDSVPQGVSDMMPYFQKAGATAPALEFLSPIKGPNLENITVEVGSGITSALDGAKAYDQDVIKQARQLGLKGW